MASMQQRRGTYQEWYDNNPLLESGEIGYITSGTYSGKIKIGDGTTLWRLLPIYEDATNLPEGGTEGQILAKNSATDYDAEWIDNYTNTQVDTLLSGKANSSHTHPSSDIVSGTLDIDRIPTGTTGTTVSLGDHDHSSLYQPLDADLTSIAGLTGTTGLLKKTATNTWELDSTSYALLAGAAFTGDLSTTGKLSVLASSGSEGGEIFLNKSVSGTTINTGVTIDVYENKLRIFETGGSNRGTYIDLSTAATSVGTNLLSAAVDTNYYPTDIVWNTGTTSGPTLDLTMAGGAPDITAVAIPVASDTASGVVNTTTQSFAGDKTFTGDVSISGSFNIIPSGSIQMFAGASAPAGWLVCNGAGFSSITYPDLAAVVGDIYGAHSGTTYYLPNMSGRVPIGAGTATGAAGATAHTMGQYGGEETHVLIVSEMPVHTHIQDSHNHTQNSHNHTQDSHNHSQNAHGHGITDPTHRHNTLPGYLSFADAFAGGTLSGIRGAAGGTAINTGYAATGVSVDATTATNNATTATNQASTATNNATTATNQNTGGNAAHNNMQPFVVVNYIIKT
jgi:microcystin-dependent protein